jgi:hypothetical protein
MPASGVVYGTSGPQPTYGQYPQIPQQQPSYGQGGQGAPAYGQQGGYAPPPAAYGAPPAGYPSQQQPAPGGYPGYNTQPAGGYTNQPSGGYTNQPVAYAQQSQPQPQEYGGKAADAYAPARPSQY